MWSAPVRKRFVCMFSVCGGDKGLFLWGGRQECKNISSGWVSVFRPVPPAATDTPGKLPEQLKAQSSSEPPWQGLMYRVPLPWGAQLTITQ